MLNDLDLDSRPQGYKTVKTAAPMTSQSLQLIWLKFALLFRLVALMNLMLTLFCPINVQGRGCYKSDFVKASKEHLRPVSSKLVMMIDTTELCIMMLVWWPRPLFKATVAWESTFFCTHFLFAVWLGAVWSEVAIHTCTQFTDHKHSNVWLWFLCWWSRLTLLLTV